MKIGLHTIDQISRKVITLLRVENIALVTELPGTGGKAEPSSQRDRMLSIMRRHDVPNLTNCWTDPSTAMVTAEVIVPPAARKTRQAECFCKFVETLRKGPVCKAAG